MAKLKKLQAVKADSAGELIGFASGLVDGLWRMKDRLAEWDDDRLRELYMSAGKMGAAAYAMQAYICRLLASRRSGGDGSVSGTGLRGAANYLGISYSTARRLSAVWESVLAPLIEREQEIPDLPPAFFVEAWKGKRYADPVEAVKYAVHVRNALGWPYPIRAFRADIRSKLPAPEEREEVIPTCRACQHFQIAPPGAQLLLVVNSAVVARGSGDGVEYCARNKMLKTRDFVAEASECPHFEKRIT